MTIAAAPSYASGTSGTPLLEDTIGEEMCGWVQLREGAAQMSAATLEEYATGKLAHYETPRYVLVVDEFPMTVTGTVRKVVMREKPVDLLELDEAAGVRNARPSLGLHDGSLRPARSALLGGRHTRYVR